MSQRLSWLLKFYCRTAAFFQQAGRGHSGAFGAPTEFDGLTIKLSHLDCIQTKSHVLCKIPD